MKVVVVGAGIIGVCTAYYLRRAGLDVTVLDRRPGVAQEASFANAGVLAPGYVGPWAAPGMPGKVLAQLFRSESPIVVRPGLDPALWRWLLRWLSECSAERYRRNRGRMQRLAFYSLEQLKALRELHQLDYEQSTGYLQLFRGQRELEAAATTQSMLTELGVRHQLLSPEECRRVEPALSEAATLAGALHLPDDETGNCAFFAQQLKGIAIEDGVEFLFGTDVKAIESSGGRVERLLTDKGDVRADAYVIAGGVDGGALLRPLGIRLPMMAVKGYSATIAVDGYEHAPTIGVMDESYKVAITRMGKRLRIAGTAEVGTRGAALRDSAVRTLVKVAHDWFPYAAKYHQASFWVGARPMLPDGPPVIGATSIPNLFLNTGHGSSGWVMACGSGRIVTDVISGRAADIDLEGLTVARYVRQPAAA